jgi:hypothetical protein
MKNIFDMGPAKETFTAGDDIVGREGGGYKWFHKEFAGIIAGESASCCGFASYVNTALCAPIWS